MSNFIIFPQKKLIWRNHIEQVDIFEIAPNLAM